MTNYDNEQKALDAAINDEHAGLVLAVLGYTLLAFAAIPAVWLWVGWRDGSMFWLWWVMGIGTGGAAFATAGAFYRARAAKDIAALGGFMRGGIAPSIRAEHQMPSVEEVDRRASGHEREVA